MGHRRSFEHEAIEVKDVSCICDTDCTDRIAYSDVSRAVAEFETRRSL